MRLVLLPLLLLVSINAQADTDPIFEDSPQPDPLPEADPAPQTTSLQMPQFAIPDIKFNK